MDVFNTLLRALAVCHGDNWRTYAKTWIQNLKRISWEAYSEAEERVLWSLFIKWGEYIGMFIQRLKSLFCEYFNPLALEMDIWIVAHH